MYGLFRRTTMYGRGLASIVPLLGWCADFELIARVRLSSGEGELRLGPSDPIGRSRSFTPYDSKLEQRFARDVAKQLPDWELLREPEPVEAGGALIFPDFELRHRAEPGRRFLVEVIGFWTPDYLERKVRHLQAVGRSDLVLCIDETRCAAVEALLPDYPVVPFERRIDPHLVLAAAAELPPSPAPEKTLRIEPVDLHLDFAGRHSPSDPIHDRLEALHAGDPVRIEARGKTIDIVTETGVIARMSRRGSARLGPSTTPICGRIIGKTRRHAHQSGRGYRHLLRCPSWWLPVVELDSPPADDVATLSS